MDGERVIIWRYARIIWHRRIFPLFSPFMMHSFQISRHVIYLCYCTRRMRTSTKPNMLSVNIGSERNKVNIYQRSLIRDATQDTDSLDIYPEQSKLLYTLIQCWYLNFAITSKVMWFGSEFIYNAYMSIRYDCLWVFHSKFSYLLNDVTVILGLNNISSCRCIEALELTRADLPWLLDSTSILSAYRNFVNKSLRKLPFFAYYFCKQTKGDPLGNASNLLIFV